jgi:3-hydroxymyristoyl/3-hydroxydecanoyl-(acyl carrier protein) dehydratase
LARFINRIVSFDSNTLCSQWNLTGAEDFFRDHFEGMPVLPGMMILESMVTAATWFARKDSEFRLLNFRLLELTNYKLPNSVRPPETLSIKIEMIDKKEKTLQFRGKAEASGQAVGHGSFSLISETQVDSQSVEFYSNECKTTFERLTEAQ